MVLKFNIYFVQFNRSIFEIFFILFKVTTRLFMRNFPGTCIVLSQNVFTFPYSFATAYVLDILGAIFFEYILKQTFCLVSKLQQVALRRRK